MQRYNVSGQLGVGAFGVVFKAVHTTTGETVAIKRMKQSFHSWEECLQLREIQSLRRLQHANVIKLKEVIRENAELMMVFEFMEKNVFEITNDRKEMIGTQPGAPPGFNEREIRSIVCQTLLGLQYIHKSGFFHRDLKPENLLTKGDVVKVADFGLAKEIRSRPPFTEYVSTRWYRAPEIILRAPNYNSPIDIWALGVIMAELYTLHPLFPGSSDTDQLFKICSLLGAPGPEWDEGHQLARKINIRFPTMSPTPLRQILPTATPVALDFMESMLRFNPHDRPTATQLLQHPFITGQSSAEMSSGGGYGGSSYSSGGSNATLFQGISTKSTHNPFHLAAGVPIGGVSGLGGNTLSGGGNMGNRPPGISGGSTPMQSGSPMPGATPMGQGGRMSGGVGAGFVGAYGGNPGAGGGSGMGSGHGGTGARTEPSPPHQYGGGSGSGNNTGYNSQGGGGGGGGGYGGNNDLPNLRSGTPPSSNPLHGPGHNSYGGGFSAGGGGGGQQYGGGGYQQPYNPHAPSGGGMSQMGGSAGGGSQPYNPHQPGGDPGMGGGGYNAGPSAGYQQPASSQQYSSSTQAGKVPNPVGGGRGSRGGGYSYHEDTDF